MKAIRIHAPKKFQLDEIGYPELGSDDVLVEVKACGVCGSDLAYIDAGVASFNTPVEGPSALGHEAAGKIVAVGSAVEKFDVGDRVAINPIDNITHSAIGNGMPEGAFAEVVRVRNIGQGGRLIKLADSLPYDIAALAEPLGVAMHAVNRSEAGLTDKVVIFGVGPIGLGAVIWLKHKGVKHVVAIDLSQERLARATQFGADGVINAKKESVTERLLELHGKSNGGAPDTDIFIDAAGSAIALNQAIQYAKFGATFTVVAVHKQPVELDLCAMVIKEMKLIASMGYPSELDDVVSFLSDNVEKMRGYISDNFFLDDFDSAIARARESSSAKVMVHI